ncbi:MAG: hypothetical protein NWF01_10550 [Candidatus Bathyarchaeota archaeon]|nr:hypothetical protein [Candidatus Bathyarchaeota archaeon]
MKLDSRFSIITLTTLLILSTLYITAIAQTPSFTVNTTTAIIYKDGLAHITQTLTADELLPEIIIPILSSSTENILILDQNNQAIDYQTNTTHLTIFTLGATQILVEYDTVLLTNKNADLWTLTLNNPYDLTVILPKNSTIMYLNNVPDAIETTGTELSLSLSPGQWEISYNVPLQTDEQASNEPATVFPSEYLLIGGIITAVIIVAIVVFVFLQKKKINTKKIIKQNPSLVAEDIAVIEFLAQQKGKAFEAEIRQKFPEMPRTSLWRLVRRLEGLEIVEVKKIGLENQVQLKK